jgi:hypothetical protein
MTALPTPDWSRPGETWRIEPESEWTTKACEATACDGQGHRCQLTVVARRLDHRFHSCAYHLHSGLMWIEDDHVVSWRLARLEHPE